MASPRPRHEPDCETVLNYVFQSASDDELSLFKGRTPLLFATYHNGGTTEYLLDHGANQDKANHDVSSLLHYAAN